MSVSLTVAGGLAVTGASAADLPALITSSHATSQAAGEALACQSVNAAIISYTADRGVAPTAIGELWSYTKRDFDGYTIDHGRAVGPGCASGRP
ncbi:hypothetical protein [Catenuloplanes japonicus]|uniref:hypothetical protein n=1 Tax=Catenuloplanes japonicus TaxID=33876 RepID=UPI000527269E|nr:hypothetical protein [Catenuloplanes japonicus]